MGADRPVAFTLVRLCFTSQDGVCTDSPVTLRLSKINTTDNDTHAIKLFQGVSTIKISDFSSNFFGFIYEFHVQVECQANL